MKKRPKIALLTEWFAPGYKAGGPIRSCVNFVREMSDDFDIYVFTADRDFGEEMPYPDVVTDQWLNWESRAKVYYFSRENLNRAVLLTQIQSVEPDFLYLNSMFSLPFTIWPLWMKWRNQLSAEWVLAPRGMLHAGALQYKRLKKWLFLKLLRLSGVSRSLIYQATDKQEISDIQLRLGRDLEIRLAANFPVQLISSPPSLSKTSGVLRVLFLSRVAPKKNLDFLLRLLPAVEGTIVLDVFGPQEEGYWDQCKQMILQLPDRIEVRYRGELRYEQVRPTLIDYHVFVLPTYGENFGHAIFESLAAARPVLISDQTPWHGLEPASAGWDFSLEQPEAFIDALNLLVSMNQEAWDQWKEGAWNYARAYKMQAGLKSKYLEIFAA